MSISTCSGSIRVVSFQRKGRIMLRFSTFRALVLALTLMLATLGGAALAQDDTTVEVELGEWYVDMPTTIPAGPLTLNVTNAGNMVHTLAIQGEGISLGENLGAGESATMQIDLEPGTYTFICPIAGHAELGMTIQVTVEEVAVDPTPVPADPTPVPTDPTPTDPDATPTPPDPTPTDPDVTPTPLPGVPATGAGGTSSDGASTTLLTLIALATAGVVIGGGLLYRNQRRAT
jgi:plastocyanin